MTLQDRLKNIAKGVDEIVNIDELKEKLIKSDKTGKPLIVKLGLDPTAPDIHIGHTVVLRKAKLFQDMGHQVVIIIGDYTGMIGDPTGKSEIRKQLTFKEVSENAETYKTQIFKILNKDKTIIKFNSEWFNGFNFQDVIQLCSKMTVARMLERDDFSERYDSNKPIYINEFLYPLMQGYDSIKLECDIELGGTDQRFNILTGRNIQRSYNMENIQVGIFMPILEGTDGIQKMSKSLNNYIGISESPKNIYGKVMSIPDDLIIRYYELVTDLSIDEIEEKKEMLGKEGTNPRDLKMDLAYRIVSQFHDNEAATIAQNDFINIFQKRLVPEDIQNMVVNSNQFTKWDFINILFNYKLASSKSEINRLIKYGALKINKKKVDFKNDNINLNDGDILQLGKKTFRKINIQYN